MATARRIKSLREITLTKSKLNVWDVNKKQQIVLEVTGKCGPKNKLHRIIKVGCLNCSHKYHAYAGDFHGAGGGVGKKCPKCQGGSDMATSHEPLDAVMSPSDET